MKLKSLPQTCTIVDCLVVALICLFVLFPQYVVQTSNTILGRLIAIACIVYYSSKHLVYGFLCCVVIISFYCHYGYSNLENFQMGDADISQTTLNFQDHIPKSRLKQGDGTMVPHQTSTHTEVNTAYPDNVSKILPEREEVFRKDHCTVDNVVVYKNTEVRNEMIPHISEIEYNDEVCNPCDSQCHFSLREKQAKTESAIQSSNTRDYPDFVPEQIKKLGLFTQSGEPFTGVKDAFASFL